MLYVWQALDLLACIAWHTCAALLSLPLLLLRVALGHSLDSEQQDACTYYEGIVTHVRRAPVENKFRCAQANADVQRKQQLLWGLTLHGTVSNRLEFVEHSGYLSRYPVRTALVLLDAAPAWFVRSQAGDHLTAQQARQYAATDGECTVMLRMMQNNALRTLTDYCRKPLD